MEGGKARDNGKECGVEWMSKRQDLVGGKNILPKEQDKIKRKTEDGCLQLNKTTNILVYVAVQKMKDGN